MPEPGIIHTWTFDQTRVWINVKGEELQLWEIDREYALNIIVFLLRGAARFRTAYARQHGKAPEAVFESNHTDNCQWIESKPLFKALRERVLSTPITLTAFGG